ncbi:MAG: class I SAM-dependent methyltransferase [Proteobacteria bacterium]|nr:class I SAM-dependent methyltransferase [Pseudomonadota bacterium]
MTDASRAIAQGSTAAPAPRRWTWTIVRRLVAAWFRDRDQFKRPMVPRNCPICGYHGIFVSVGRPSRWDVRCLQCGSRERHRLTHLWVTEGGADKLAGKRILHFAPEKTVVRQMRGNPLYETADLRQRATHQVDISQVALPDAGYDVVMAHHVLEHVDADRAAMRELFRLLKPGGTALLSTPINPSRRETYENPAITAPALRSVHFGNEDHKRYYGLDFADRLAQAGFRVEIFRLPPEDEARYGLLRDEWIYIARKPGA